MNRNGYRSARQEGAFTFVHYPIVIVMKKRIQEYCGNVSYTLL